MNFNIPTDKKYHLIAGAAIALFVSFALSPDWGLLAAVVAGILKEVIWDHYLGKGDPDVLDAIATGLGGLVVTIITSIVFMFF